MTTTRDKLLELAKEAGFHVDTDGDIWGGENGSLERFAALLSEAQEGEPSIPEALFKIGELLHTQDNRCTDQPLFIVQQKRTITGIDTEYTDKIAWVDSDIVLTSGEEFDELEAAYQETCEEPDGWTRTGYHDEWEFVTACFTEQGCRDYLAIDGHNLKEPRIYADGSYRNIEYRLVRDWLRSLKRPSQAQEPGDLTATLSALPVVGTLESIGKPGSGRFAGHGSLIPQSEPSPGEPKPCRACDPSVGVVCDEHCEQSSQATDDRFFMDHGLWHDRVTGQHLYTQDQYDEEKRLSFKEGYDRRNEELALSRVQAAPELSDDEIVKVLHSLGIDTHPSKYGFTALQVSGTSVPMIREIVRAYLAAAPSVNEQEKS